MATLVIIACCILIGVIAGIATVCILLAAIYEGRI